MTTHTPDRFVLIRTFYEGVESVKVFGTWFGGYLDGDAWRASSSILPEGREVGEHYTKVSVESGSEYLLPGRKDFRFHYGTSMYTGNVLEGFLNGVKNIPHAKMEVLTEDEAYQYIFGNS